MAHKMKLFFRSVFIISSLLLVIAFEAFPANSQLFFLIEANHDCGSGYVYRVPEGKYSSQQIEILRTVFRFIYGGNFNALKTVGFEIVVRNPASYDEIINLRDNPNTNKWLGPRVFQSLSVLHNERSKLYSIPPPKDPDKFFSSAELANYNKARSNAIKEISQRFEIVELENDTTCD
jgi:hypothetical protein